MTSLYSLRARYYDAGVGQFLSRDVYPYSLSSPLELNRYAYAASNPINFSDPTGYTAFAEYATNVGKGALAGAAISGLSDAAIQLLTQPINEFSLEQVLRATVAGAVAGAVGAMIGIGGAALGNRFTTVVLTGALDGWLSGMLSRGVTNWLMGNSFFDGYSWQAALIDTFTGGLMSGVFYGVGKAINGLGKSVKAALNYFESRICTNSFSADTTVVTKDGNTPIHEIQIGDYVLAWNEETNEISFERVTDTIHHTDEIVVHLTIDGEEIQTTPEHPFYVKVKGWVNAKDLQVGDNIRNAGGSTGQVESVEIEETSQQMYNLTVDEAHTFFVGDGQWLVHNACDFSRILYGSDEMSRAAQQFRLATGMKKGNNVAVFQIAGSLPESLLENVANYPNLIRADGDLLIARNIGDDGAHSEEVLYQMLTGHGVDPSRVTAVYSEFSPCTSGHNCFRLLNEIGGFRDNLPVTYSFIWHREEALKAIAERALFQRGYPGIIRP